MVMTWKPYVDGKMISQHPTGFYIVKPVNQSSDSNPLFCPVCDSIMNSVYDDEMYRKYTCCDSCANRWAYKNSDAWLSGWRPSPEEINKSKVEDT